MQKDAFEQQSKHRGKKPASGAHWILHGSSAVHLNSICKTPRASRREQNTIGERPAAFKRASVQSETLQLRSADACGLSLSKAMQKSAPSPDAVTRGRDRRSLSNRYAFDGTREFLTRSAPSARDCTARTLAASAAPGRKLHCSRGQGMPRDVPTDPFRPKATGSPCLPRPMT